MRIIDLSTTIEQGSGADIAYTDHKTGAEQISASLKVPADLLRDSEGWAYEILNGVSTHGCTHVDAPYHYNSHIDGKPAQTIDELPLEWFYGDGILFEMRHKVDGDAVTVPDLEEELARIDYRLKPLDIVLIRNGQDEHYGKDDYAQRGCGVTAEATKWLYEQGIRVMGIDAWGWDRPLQMQAEEAIARKSKGIFWEAHQAGIPYCQIERLVNLAPLPSLGFKVACFPLKIKGASGAPARTVAILAD